MRALVLILFAAPVLAQDYARLAWAEGEFLNARKIALSGEAGDDPRAERRGRLDLGETEIFDVGATGHHLLLGTGLPRPWREKRRMVTFQIDFTREAAPRKFAVQFFYDGTLTVSTRAYRKGFVTLGGRRRVLSVHDGNADLRFDHPEHDFLRIDRDGDGESDHLVPLGESFALRGKRYRVAVLDPSAEEVVFHALGEASPDPLRRTLEALAAGASGEETDAALQLAAEGPYSPRLAALLGRVRDPAAIDELLARLEAKLPSLRRLAAEALASVPDARVTVALAARRSKEEDGWVQQALDSALSRRADPDRVRDLRRKAESGDADAAEALLEFRPRDAVVNEALLRLLESRDGHTLVVVLTLLPASRDRELAAAVARTLRHRAWQVRLAACEALRRIRLKESIPPLIERMAKEDNERVQAALVKSLFLLTHERLPERADLWRDWWERRGKDFVVPGRPPSTKPKHRARRTVSKFYGVPIQSKRVIFVIDQSASMTASYPDGGTRWSHALSELHGAIDKLPTGASTNVIAFQTGVWRWRTKLTPVTKSSRAKLSRQMRGLKPSGGTWLFEGLAAALEDKHVEEIYLLSDGAPSGGEFVSAHDIIREIRRRNRFRRVIIHTISIGTDSDLLRKLAAANDGQYVRK